MSGLQDYRGCHATVYDESKTTTLGNAKITKFNHSSYIATLILTPPLMTIPDRITVRIFHPNGVHEYKGSTRQRDALSSAVEIALYKGTLEDERIAPRYPLSTTAQVERTLPDGNTSRAEVTLLNLSNSGCLIRAGNGAFYPEDCFRIRLPITGGAITLMATVVRLTPSNSAETDYGCLLSPL